MTFSAATGYRRIHGELVVMGIHLSSASVWNTLKRHDLDPASGRTGISWRELLETQAKTMLACDFFTVEEAKRMPSRASSRWMRR